LTSGIVRLRSVKRSLRRALAATRIARPMPRWRATFSLTSTAAAAPSTFTEHISLVFG
jgi:hypothetical protein